MDGQQKLRKTYFEIFVFSQILCLLPIPKAILFFLPLFSILWFLKRNPLKYSFAKYFLIFISVISYIPIYFFIRDGDFFISNFLLSILFYSSFLFIFIAKSNYSVDLEYFNAKYIPVIKWIIIVESCIGVLQVIFAGEGVDLSSGDYIQGTINFFSFINHQNGFSNVIYVINMTSLLIVYYALSYRRSRVVILICCLAIVLSSTIHLSLALIGAILITYMTVNIFKSVKIMMPIILFFVILYAFFPRNFSSLTSYKKQIVELKNLKVKSSIITASALIDSPKDLLFGYGLGQYSSRSALIFSGNYFYNKRDDSFRSIYGIKNQTTIFKKNIKESWITSITNDAYGFSVMSKPVYSILSLISELGIIVFGVLVAYFLNFIFRINKAYKNEKRKMHKKKNLILLLLTFFLVGISFFENYLEIAQAIFPTLVLIKLLSLSKKRKGY